MGFFESIIDAVFGGIISSLFGGKDKEPAAPAIKPPTVMPTPGDEPSRAAKRLSLKQQRERQGRASTILTSDTVTSDTLGA